MRSRAFLRRLFSPRRASTVDRSAASSSSFALRSPACLRLIVRSSTISATDASSCSLYSPIEISASSKAASKRLMTLPLSETSLSRPMDSFSRDPILSLRVEISSVLIWTDSRAASLCSMAASRCSSAVTILS